MQISFVYVQTGDKI